MAVALIPVARMPQHSTMILPQGAPMNVFMKVASTSTRAILTQLQALKTAVASSENARDAPSQRRAILTRQSR